MDPSSVPDPAVSGTQPPAQSPSSQETDSSSLDRTVDAAATQAIPHPESSSPTTPLIKTHSVTSGLISNISEEEFNAAYNIVRNDFGGKRFLPKNVDEFEPDISSPGERLKALVTTMAENPRPSSKFVSLDARAKVYSELSKQKLQLAALVYTAANIQRVSQKLSSRKEPSAQKSPLEREPSAEKEVSPEGETSATESSSPEGETAADKEVSPERETSATELLSPEEVLEKAEMALTDYHVTERQFGEAYGVIQQFLEMSKKERETGARKTLYDLLPEDVNDFETNKPLAVRMGTLIGILKEHADKTVFVKQLAAKEVPPAAAQIIQAASSLRDGSKETALSAYKRAKGQLLEHRSGQHGVLASICFMFFNICSFFTIGIIRWAWKTSVIQSAKDKETEKIGRVADRAIIKNKIKKTKYKPIVGPLEKKHFPQAEDAGKTPQEEAERWRTFLDGTLKKTRKIQHYRRTGLIKTESADEQKEREARGEKLMPPLVDDFSGYAIHNVSKNERTLEGLNAFLFPPDEIHTLQLVWYDNGNWGSSIIERLRRTPPDFEGLKKSLQDERNRLIGSADSGLGIRVREAHIEYVDVLLRAVEQYEINTEYLQYFLTGQIDGEDIPGDNHFEKFLWCAGIDPPQSYTNPDKQLLNSFRNQFGWGIGQSGTEDNIPFGHTVFSRADAASQRTDQTVGASRTESNTYPQFRNPVFDDAHLGVYEDFSKLYKIISSGNTEAINEAKDSLRAEKNRLEQGVRLKVGFAPIYRAHLELVDRMIKALEKPLPVREGTDSSEITDDELVTLISSWSVRPGKAKRQWLRVEEKTEEMTVEQLAHLSERVHAMHEKASINDYRAITRNCAQLQKLCLNKFLGEPPVRIPKTEPEDWLPYGASDDYGIKGTWPSFMRLADPCPGEEPQRPRGLAPLPVRGRTHTSDDTTVDSSSSDTDSTQPYDATHTIEPYDTQSDY